VVILINIGREERTIYVEPLEMPEPPEEPEVPEREPERRPEPDKVPAKT